MCLLSPRSPGVLSLCKYAPLTTHPPTHPGWYGHDCSRKKAGLEVEPSKVENVRYLNNVVRWVAGSCSGIRCRALLLRC